MSICNRLLVWTVVGATFALFGSAANVVQPEDVPVAADTDRCRTEVWRVVVSSVAGTPKYTLPPQIEVRSVLVCDDETFAELQRRLGKRS